MNFLVDLIILLFGGLPLLFLGAASSLIYVPSSELYTLLIESPLASDVFSYAIRSGSSIESSRSSINSFTTCTLFFSATTELFNWGTGSIDWLTKGLMVFKEFVWFSRLLASSWSFKSDFNYTAANSFTLANKSLLSWRFFSVTSQTWSLIRSSWEVQAWLSYMSWWISKDLKINACSHIFCRA